MTTVDNQEPECKVGLEEKWLEAHREQLKHSELPEQLWTTLAEKVVHRIYDAGNYIEFHRVDSPLKRCQFQVVALNSLEEADDLFLVNHIWNFSSVAEAHTHLHDENIKGLSSRIAQIFDLDFEAADSQCSGKIEAEIIDNLVHFAFPHVIRSGSETLQEIYSVYDELGSRLQFAENKDDPKLNCKFISIFDVMQQRFISVIFTTRRIEAHEELKRLPAARIEHFQAQKSYWTDRFDTEGQCEWLASYSTLKPLIEESRKCEREDAQVIILGCGNSTLGFDMHKDGYPNISSVDFAENVIDQMKVKHGTGSGGLSWHVADLRALPETEFPCSKFHFAIDKGTLDSMLALGKQGWINPNVNFEDLEDETWVKAISAAQKYLKEVHRILLPTVGVFFLVSLGSPEFRVPLLEKCNLEVQQIKLLEPQRQDREDDEAKLKLKWNGQYHNKHIYICTTAKPQ